MFKCKSQIHSFEFYETELKLRHNFLKALINFIHFVVSDMYLHTFANSRNSYMKSISPKDRQNPENEITQTTNIKRQKPDLQKNEENSINERSSIHRIRYPTESQFIQSDISSWTTFLQTSPDRDLAKFEGYFTEEILMLKEDKLTLMTERNRILGRKFDLQRALGKLRQKKENNERESMSIFQRSSEQPHAVGEQIIPMMEQFDEAIKKNQFLKQQYRELEESIQKNSGYSSIQEEEDIIAIRILQEQSKMIEERILEFPEQKSLGRESKRFQTFFPESQEQKLLELQEERDGLYYHFAERIPQPQLREKALALAEENNDFRCQHRKILKRRMYTTDSQSLSRLREKVEVQDESKILFFQDLKRFKAEMIRVREENAVMRSNLWGNGIILTRG